MAVLDMSHHDPDLATDLLVYPAKTIDPGTYFYAAIAKELSSAIKVFDQIFTWPSDQPRHATHASSIRSIPIRPLKNTSPTTRLNQFISRSHAE